MAVRFFRPGTPGRHQSAVCRPAAARQTPPLDSPGRKLGRKPAGCDDRLPWPAPLDVASWLPQLSSMATSRSTLPPRRMMGISWAHEQTH
jgi:hypothetical protein